MIDMSESNPNLEIDDHKQKVIFVFKIEPS
jgi:hypothetical protein